MPEVMISDTEWYPVPCYERRSAENTEWGVFVDVPEEVLARYDAANAALDAAFAELNTYRKKG